mgnify:FL=1
MGDIKIDFSHAGVKFTDEIKEKAEAANNLLSDGRGKGSDFLGWVRLPMLRSELPIDEINETARLLQKECEVVVVVGIGGSYLGARAVIEALSDPFDMLKKDRRYPIVVYAGHNMSEDYLFELQSFLRNRKFGIICISKSGTTTEPALAFRLLRRQLEEQQGTESARRLIVAITDKKRGALKTFADTCGYKSYVIEDNIGGRYSVLTPVGLLPIAIAGFDIDKLIDGALEMAQDISCLPFDSGENVAIEYAAARYLMFEKGKQVEVLANFNPKLHYFAEWWKQLYGESEGKEHKGLFPAAVDYTTDLHSMGQYMQEGVRMMFETFIYVDNPRHEVYLGKEPTDLDGLNFLAGQRIDFINRKAYEGTVLAHTDGGVPNINITISRLDEHCIGQLIYFFEKACGISGYMLGVNPFDQPGVEAYKKNMFALLKKPGYETEYDAISKRLK